MKFISLIVLSSILFLSPITLFAGTQYPSSQEVTAPEWYAEFFTSMNIDGTYYSSSDSIQTIASWFKKSSQYSVYKQDATVTILTSASNSVVIMDKAQQLDEEFKNLFSKTMILIITGDKTSRENYLQMF